MAIRHTTVVCSVAVVLFVGWTALPVGQPVQPPANETGGGTVTPAVSEPTYIAPVPEPGDPRFEAAASDGSWVSYENPRDEYRSPYLGEGSGKMCVTLLNEAGEPIVGESIPNTTVTIDTGVATSWHSTADPFTVEFPLTEHYEVPVDSDQFGSSPDYAQGDGLLDSHCIEFHGLTETARVTFEEAHISGDHAEDVDIVGYIVQANQAWNSSVDPLEDVEPYVSTGGQWMNEPNGSHGQLVVVMQLDRATTSAPDDQAPVSSDESGLPREVIPVTALVIGLCAVALGGWVRLRR